MENRVRLIEHVPAARHFGRNLEDEIKELGKLRTAVMLKKCSTTNETLVCPIPVPRKKTIRSTGVHNDHAVMGDLSDIITSKASPPYFTGSPPIRLSNPLVQDSHFCNSGKKFVGNFIYNC